MVEIYKGDVVEQYLDSGESWGDHGLLYNNNVKIIIIVSSNRNGHCNDFINKDFDKTVKYIQLMFLNPMIYKSTILQREVTAANVHFNLILYQHLLTGFKILSVVRKRCYRQTSSSTPII